MFEPDVFVSPVFDEEENESDSLPSNIDTDNEQGEFISLVALLYSIRILPNSL